MPHHINFIDEFEEEYRDTYYIVDDVVEISLRFEAIMQADDKEYIQKELKSEWYEVQFV